MKHRTGNAKGFAISLCLPALHRQTKTQGQYCALAAFSLRITSHNLASSILIDLLQHSSASVPTISSRVISLPSLSVPIGHAAAPLFSFGNHPDMHEYFILYNEQHKWLNGYLYWAYKNQWP